MLNDAIYVERPDVSWRWMSDRGGELHNATEYKVRFSKPYQDKSLDEWWPATKLDAQQIRVYVVRKTRKERK